MVINWRFTDTREVLASTLDDAALTNVIGKDTIPAMQSGMYWGYVSLIEGLVARIKSEYGKPMTVIATGGLAELIHKESRTIEVVDQLVTLEGLRLLFERHFASEGKK